MIFPIRLRCGGIQDRGDWFSFISALGWIAAELACVKIVVKTFFLQQFLVFTTFHDLTSVDHQQKIRISNGAQAMRDHKGGAPPEQFLERFLDEPLGAGIHAGGGFIQDENAGIIESSPRDGDQLPLPLREATAAFSQHGLVSIRKVLDETHRRWPAWPQRRPLRRSHLAFRSVCSP